MDKCDIIQIDRLSKQYKDSDFHAIEELSLTIQQGEIFGLLGPNGAGKTTLISILCGLIKPTSGQFTIDNKHYKRDGMRIRQLIGVVPQEYALYPTLTAAENLAYFGAMHGLRGKVLNDLINASLTKMGLTRFAHKPLESFSGGMKRRVNLLAGTLHHPKVLFLDEPTVGVDVQSKNVILDFLKGLNADGATIVYTSHHLLEAQELCDRVAIIEGGQVIAEGTPQQLIADTKHSRNLEEVFIALTGKGLRDAV